MLLTMMQTQEQLDYVSSIIQRGYQVAERNMAAEEEKYESTIEFINAFREQRCLWDHTSPEYQSRVAKKLAYRSLSDTFGINEIEVEKKWRNLRSYYTQLLAKMTKRSEDPELATPKWPFYHAMSFLQHIIQPKKHFPPTSYQEGSDLYSQDSGQYPSQVAIQPSQVQNFTPQHAVPEKRIKLSPSLYEESILELTSSPRSSNSPAPQQLSANFPPIRSEASVQSPTPQIIAQSLQPIKSEEDSHLSPPQNDSIGRKDEWDVFGEMVAHDMRKLPPARQNEMRFQIQKLFYEELKANIVQSC